LVDSKHVIVYFTQPCRHHISLAYYQSFLIYIYGYFRLISQSINFHIQFYVKCQSRISRATFLWYLIIQCCPRRNKNSCNKKTIFTARGRSTESAAWECPKGPQRECRGSALFRHFRAHRMAVGPFNES